MKKNVAIVGGGLAGLISAIELSTKGVPCSVFEKRNYPFHRVCGEYISNEALPYLKTRGLYPEHLSPHVVNTFNLTSIRGRSATLPLDLGGFGLSRFAFDHFLAQKASDLGARIHENTDVKDVRFLGDKFLVKTDREEMHADVVIAAHGKRSKLDQVLDRQFLKRRSPYVGVKYHVRAPHPDNTVSLHNFSGGYCGVVNVENDRTNLCYLVRREVLQAHKNIPMLEQRVLAVNPHLRPYLELIDRSDDPVVINEISFATKSPVEDHILMAGDAAGMITPLCGNGMAMAIHSAKLVADAATAFCSDKISRTEMETTYAKSWNTNFRRRLQFGRGVQKLFGSQNMSGLSVTILNEIPPLGRLIIRNTHGPVFY